MSTGELTPSKIRYLVALTKMDPDDHGIRSVTLARTLHISRPSVHAMIDKLSDMGCVNKEHYGIIYLTSKGKEIGTHYEKDFPLE